MKKISQQIIRECINQYLSLKNIYKVVENLGVSPAFVSLVLKKNKIKTQGMLGRKHTQQTIEEYRKVRNTPEWKGKIYTPKRNKKISKKMMGNTRGIKNLLKGGREGKLHSEATKEKIRNYWRDKQYRERVIKKCLKRLKDRPTKLEREAIKIIKENRFPYKYVGDGSFLIGYKNPDFIHIKDKICLEVCNYFHHQGDYKKKRINYFGKWGWDCFVFYEDEFEKLRNFLAKHKQAVLRNIKK